MIAAAITTRLSADDVQQRRLVRVGAGAVDAGRHEQRVTRAGRTRRAGPSPRRRSRRSARGHRSAPVPGRRKSCGTGPRVDCMRATTLGQAGPFVTLEISRCGSGSLPADASRPTTHAPAGLDGRARGDHAAVRRAELVGRLADASRSGRSRNAIRNVARPPAAEEAARKLEPILDGDRRPPPGGVARRTPIASIAFGLFTLYAVAAVLSRDRNGRRLALLTAMLRHRLSARRAAAEDAHREGDGRGRRRAARSSRSAPRRGRGAYSRPRSVPRST